ncbi:MAG: hypothetical protein V9E94_12825 [Microthrixaceae bacterium]
MTAPRQFGTTWWGRAWLDALEAGGSSYQSRLPRGRSYARKGAVIDMELAAGHVAARVVGRSGEIHRVDLAVRRLALSEWEQVADAIAGRAAHLAALLDGELDPGVVDDAASVEIDLIPRAGDLRTDCTCDDWVEPCKHSAAVCYLVAEEFDRNPFSLFLLRGMTRDDLIAMVRARRGDESDVAAPDESAPQPGIEAAELWQGRTLDSPLGPPPFDPHRRGSDLRQPGRRVPWGSTPPARFGIDAQRVDELADDAVERAWRMLVDDRPSGLAAAPAADLARRTVTEPRRLTELASLAGITPGRLRAWADAWWSGGDVAVQVVADPTCWQSDQDALAAGRDLLVEIGHPRRSISLNYDSLRMAGSVWLAIGPDGRWYRLQGAVKHQDLHLSTPPSWDLRELVEPIG